MAASVLWAFNVVEEENNPSSMQDADRFTLELLRWVPVPILLKMT